MHFQNCNAILFMLVIYVGGDRTGNQLVCAAHMMASAIEHQVPYWNMRFSVGKYLNHKNGGLHHLYHDDNRHLLRRACIKLHKYAKPLLRFLRIEFTIEPLAYAECHIDDFIRTAHDRKLHLWDFWLYTDFKALLKHQNEVRQRLAFKEKYVNAAKALLASLRRDDSIIIGIHMRRGDYAKWQGGRFCFSDAQYADWMKQCAAAADKPVRFIVCSDSPCDEDYFLKQFPSVTFSKADFITDIAILSLCDYIIGPPSTFSGWASFLGNTPKFSVNKAASKISSLEQFRVYMTEFTDIFCSRNDEGLVGFQGPNACLSIEDGVLGTFADLMEDLPPRRMVNRQVS